MKYDILKEAESSLWVTKRGDVIVYLPRTIARDTMFLKKYSKRVIVALTDEGYILIKPSEELLWLT